MKKTSVRKHQTGLRDMNRTSRMEFERADVERIEQERIDFEHRARMLRTNLYNSNPPTDMARGWIDARKK
jgi:hypothetical protein